MIKRIMADCYAEMFYKVLCAVLPFVTLGMFTGGVTLYVSSAVGAMALAGLMARICGVGADAAPGVRPALCRDVDGLLTLPYAFALSSSVATTLGVDASGGMWLALGLAVAVVAANHLTGRKR